MTHKQWDVWVQVWDEIQNPIIRNLRKIYGKEDKRSDNSSKRKAVDALRSHCDDASGNLVVACFRSDYNLSAHDVDEIGEQMAGRDGCGKIACDVCFQ